VLENARRKARAVEGELVLGVDTAVVADGRSIAWPEDLSTEQAQQLWLPGPPERTVVAVDTDGRILGSALMGPNRPGRGSHIATATFVVDEAVRGRGVGRALGEHVLAWARAAGYIGIQFNAVVETNAAAVHLWTSLGMTVVGTVPHAFRHPDHGLVALHVMFQQLNNPDTTIG